MGSWRRAELKAGVYDEIVSARLDRQLAALGANFDVHRAALTASEPIGAVLESLLGDGLVLALADLKADSAKGSPSQKRSWLCCARTRRVCSSAMMNCGCIRKGNTRASSFFVGTTERCAQPWWTSSSKTPAAARCWDRLLSHRRGRRLGRPDEWSR